MRPDLLLKSEPVCAICEAVELSVLSVAAGDAESPESR